MASDREGNGSDGGSRPGAPPADEERTRRGRLPGWDAALDLMRTVLGDGARRNLSEEEREVVVVVSGLFGAPGQPNTGHTATIRTLDCGSFPAHGVSIAADPLADPVAPDFQEVEAAFNDYIDVTHHIIHADYTPPWLTVEEIPLTIPGYSVVRIDIVPGGGEVEIQPAG